MIESAVQRFELSGCPSARLDAEVMLAAACGIERSAVLAGRLAVTPEIIARFDAMVVRREKHEPVAYILGHREFYSLEFEVSRDVLIPRPETETLVDAALAFVAIHPVARVLDIGTGSGAIAIAIAASAGAVSVVATDISAPALEIARRNAIRNRVVDRVAFVRSDLFRPLEGQASLGRFELVVSNPPYVADAEADSLAPEVREFEPRGALFAGADGLQFYRQIATGIENHLEPGGALIVEVGADGAESVMAELERAGMRIERLANDLAGIPRVVVAQRK